MRKWLLAALMLIAVNAFAQPTAEQPTALDKKEIARLEQLRDSLNGGPTTSTPDTPQTIQGKAPEAKVKEILSNPIYRDQISTEKESWLGEALETLFRRIGEWFGNLFPKPQGPAPVGAGMAGMTNAVIWILIAVLAGFIVYALASIAWKKRRAGETHEGTGLVDDEEANRSADEWLTQADRLANEGRYREAVRCLYLASLIRLDEAKILRFERHETNWEHLYRYTDAPGRLASFNLHPVTQNFDQIWYGFNTQGMPDVVWFRNEYQNLIQAIKGAKS